MPFTHRPSYYHTIVVVRNSFEHKEVCGQPHRKCCAVAVHTTTVTPSSCIRDRPRRRLGAGTTTIGVFVFASSCIVTNTNLGAGNTAIVVVSSTSSSIVLPGTPCHVPRRDHLGQINTIDIRVVVSSIRVVVFSSSSSSCYQEEVFEKLTRRHSLNVVVGITKKPYWAKKTQRPPRSDAEPDRRRLTKRTVFTREFLSMSRTECRHSLPIVVPSCMVCHDKVVVCRHHNKRTSFLHVEIVKTKNYRGT